MSKLTKLARGRDCQVPVEGFEGLYSVTPEGEVLSSKKGWAPLKPGVKPGGYEFVGLYREGRGTYRMVHRLVALAFIPNPDGKPEVNHKDGNKLNNSVGNLEWATRKENAQHGHDTGLMAQGAAHHATKLAPEQVHKIFGASGKYRDIAAEYGVCAQTVCNIKKGRIHKRALLEVVA